MNVLKKSTKKWKEFLGYEGEEFNIFIMGQHVMLHDERQAMRESEPKMREAS